MDTLSRLIAEPAASASLAGYSDERRRLGVTVGFLSSDSRLERPVSEHGQHIVLVALRNRGTAARQKSDAKNRLQLRPCSVSVLPADQDLSWERFESPCVKILVPQGLVVQVAQEMSRPYSQITLARVCKATDGLLEQLVLLLLSESGRAVHPAQLLIVESTSRALVAHLLRRYGKSSDFSEQSSPRLSPKAIDRITHYIEENLEGPIDSGQLARLANVSRFHFSLLFKRSTGTTPMKFVERARVERAKALIRSGNLSLADVALAVGFSDQAHFSRRFRCVAGCTPAAFAGQSRPSVPAQSQLEFVAVKLARPRLGIDPSRQ